MIFTILGFTATEIFMRNLRFKAFYFRLLDTILIYKKINVY